ncbi:MAG: carbohydrate binding family 9 domain-containing protein [Rhodothermales bacterium]|nr:carbohydrate binding family 9 domain-containing protein [Rhodothermales bacterium]MBO6779128.1 carbohydrate binding family 9 domain-containing protein [Rhodothermales bacterium]
MACFRLLPLGLCLLFITPEVRAQADADRSYPKTAVAHRAAEDVAVDGVLNEAVWQEASWISDFVEKEPVEGGTPSVLTEVAIVYTADALLVGARMHAQDPSRINALVTRRDVQSNAEQLVISLDTYLNRRTAYSFGITAGGARIDYYQDGDSQGNADYSFDPVWAASARVSGPGWTAEMRIPFSQLRFNESDRQVWGLNINRQIPNSNEDIYWVMVPRDETGWASRFGALTDIEGIRPSRRIELMPYVAGSGTAAAEVEEQDPFRSDFQTETRAGVDAKVGLGPNLTLDVTVNPDFGQVEADPAEVNLTAFETFFDERRPFFAEGADLLSGNHFYSRRIGARPSGFASGDFVERPDATTILGAGKLSGRLSSGLSVAALAAATEGEYARTFDVDSGEFGRTRVEPFTSYTAVAASQEFGENSSTFGFIATAVNRDLDASDDLSAILNRDAYTGQANFNIRFRGGAYVIDGSAGFSTVSGTSERIARLQSSPVHYFQRPDADYVTFDPDRTRLSGYNTDVWFGKNSGSWTGGSYVGIESAGYNPNDIGRLGRADEIAWFVTANYRETQRGKTFHRWNVDLSMFNNWNTGLEHNGLGVDVSANLTWTNFWFTSIFAGFNPTNYSDTATRGGPRMAIAGERNVGMNLSSNRARKFSARLFAYHEVDALERRDYRLSLGVNWQPSERLDLSLSPFWGKFLGNRQYATTRSGGPDATFGSRYVFSLIDRSNLSAQIRLNYTFRPDLTLEVYGEPFAATGRFYQYGELKEPGGLDLLVYGTEGTEVSQEQDGRLMVTDGADSFTLPNRDFRFVSFRSNVVLRWEWRPGSTLFLVWQQDRSGFERDGALVTAGDLFDSFSATGDHFLGLKLSYWLPVD